MNVLAAYIEGEKQKARQTFENAVVAEANGQRIKNPQSVIDALAVLNLTSKDFENAVEAEREYLRLADIASEEETLRQAMHQAGEEMQRVVEQCKSEMKAIEQRKKDASAKYEMARSDFQRANDASCRLAKCSSIGGRSLKSKLDAITSEQKECGRKLVAVREQLQRSRIDLNALHREYERTGDQACHERYKDIVARIKDLSGQEGELVQKSEQLRDRFERCRLTRGIEQESTPDDGIDGL